MENIEEKIDQIINGLLDGSISPENLSSEFNLLSDIQIPSDEKISSYSQNLIKSFDPESNPLSDDEINNLMCQNNGPGLRNRIILAVLDKIYPGFVQQNIDSNSYNIAPFDYENISNSSIFESYLISVGQFEALQRAKEIISDNLDLDGMGINFPNSGRKRRTLNLLSFTFTIEAITYGGKVLYYHIPAPDLTLDQILERLRSSKNPKQKDCAKKIYEDNGSSILEDDEIIRIIESLIDKAKKIEERNRPPIAYINNGSLTVDRNNLISNPPSGLTLLESFFCEPEIPIDPNTGDPLFTPDLLSDFISTICEPEEETPDIPDEKIPDINEIPDKVSECLDNINSIFEEQQKDNDLLARYQKAEKDLEEILYHYRIIQMFYNKLFGAINSGGSGLGGNFRPDQLSSVFKSGKGKSFIENLEKFSCRFKGTQSQSVNGIHFLNFVINYPSGFGFPLIYSTTKSDYETPFYKEKTIPDISKILIGMEFSEGGIFERGNPDFLKSYGSILTVNPLDPPLDKDKGFYFFLEKIYKSEDTKEQIIDDIRTSHGSLYSELLEVSSVPWLFFNQNERGDNDARNMEDLKPLPLLSDTQSNPTFESFWGDYKKNWDNKYNTRKNIIEANIESFNSPIDDLISELKNLYLSAANKDSSIIRTIRDINEEVNRRVNNIKTILLDIGQFSDAINQKRTPEYINGLFGSIKCSTPTPAVSTDNNSDITGNSNINSNKTMTISCPPKCCGKSGQGFVNGVPIEGMNSPDCPTMNTSCYWKEFSKYANKVGKMPIPNGIPPVEKTSQFSPPNVAFRYWPVGYLPPSFIPLPPPIVNPLDGTPLLRIPLPMIWTIIDPIIIPLPVGIIVIFIPFIGGFMPSPLVYFNDFSTGTNIFLAGIRGFRFIPRKSDPVIKDPNKKVKEYLSKGIPTSLFPIPNIGNDDIDSPGRILTESSSLLNDLLSNKKKNVDFSQINEIQIEESEIRNKYESKILDSRRRKFLDGNNEEAEIKKSMDLEISKLDNRKISAVKSSITDYLEKMVKLPDIDYPKKSSNLTKLIPSAAKNIKDKNKKSKLSSNQKSDTIDIKSRLFTYIDDIYLIDDSSFKIQNGGLPGDQKIILGFNFKMSEIGTDKDSLRKLSSKLNEITSIILGDSDSPVSPKVLGLTKSQFNFPGAPRGNKIPLPSGSSPVNSPELSEIIEKIRKVANLDSNSIKKIYQVAKNNSFSENYFLRDKDLRMIYKNLLSTRFSEMKSDPTKFPTKGLEDEGKVIDSFSKGLSSFEVPPFPPRKSASESNPLSKPGISSMIISGSTIDNFVKSGVSQLISKMSLKDIIGNINFVDISPSDIKSISSNLAKRVLNPDISTPPFISKLPNISTTSRPQDLSEFLMKSLPSHPSTDILFTQIWKKLDTSRIPIQSGIVEKMKKISNSIIYRIPWPIAILLGRSIINIINPLLKRDDLPRWDYMSLKNTYFVVFLDEFLRSAADISGGFKFFLGANKLTYPLPDLEINLSFGSISNIV